MSSPNFLKQLTGSFANPAAENPTVEMIEAAYQHHGLPFRYINFEVGPDKLADAVAGAKAMGFVGFNCSLPNKVEVIQYLDGLGESAAIMQAVNCAVNRGGKWIGENTDGKGFLASLEEVTSARGKSFVLFGAGGAARAISVEVALAGAASIRIVNRTKERAEQLATLLRERTSVQVDFDEWTNNYAIPANTDVVVNATSIGLFPNVAARLPLDVGSLRPQMVVADVIPNPLRTRLIADAEMAGCTVIDGLGMLVNQGVISIKYWTGVDVEPEVMRQRVIQVLGM
ncbi:MAG: shikimate dehydrogenase [Planctomycetales bacterium]|nr:shikimate dehydrogenase [Planctomycetales bacterium]